MIYWKTEEQALARVDRMKRDHGIWTAVRRVRGKGWILLYDPPELW